MLKIRSIVYSRSTMHAAQLINSKYQINTQSFYCPVSVNCQQSSSSQLSTAQPIAAILTSDDFWTA